MNVIIMHPKHNLEMKYKNGGMWYGVCVCVWGGVTLHLQLLRG